MLKVECFASSEFRGQHWKSVLGTQPSGRSHWQTAERLTPQLRQLCNFPPVATTRSCGIKRMIAGFRRCCQPRMGSRAVDSVSECFPRWNPKHLQHLTPRRVLLNSWRSLPLTTALGWKGAPRGSYPVSVALRWHLTCHRVHLCVADSPDVGHKVQVSAMAPTDACHTPSSVLSVPSVTQSGLAVRHRYPEASRCDRVPTALLPV